MPIIDIIKDLIKDYNYEISTLKYGILGLYKGTKIQLNEKITDEFFASIVNLLNSEFGTPIYIHSYYGLIWNKDKKYISCNFIEEIYGSSFFDICIFDRIPLGKKLSYKEYDLIDSTIKQVFCELDFRCNTVVNYARNGLFSYTVSNEKTQWVLDLKGKNMTCYFMGISTIDTKTIKLTPRYWCKKSGNFQNLETLKDAIKQSFSEYKDAVK